MECRDIINTFAPCLSDTLGVSTDLANFLSITLGVLIVATFPLLVTILLIWVERKFAARVQDRIGPNRVGPFGLFQPFADVIKLLGKEDITPAGADKWIYNASPVVMVMAVLLIWAVIPLTPVHVGVDLEIGALYFVAVASIGTLSVIMAGWASNNKYALLGSFRVVAQLISYEVPLALALLVPVMLAGSMSMVGIVEAQTGMWFVFMVPVSAFLFFISSQAETGRAPFDLLEAESELVAGFNIEYSGMKFAMFFAGEFMHVFTNGVLMAVLFTGGYVGPFVDQIPLLGLVYLLAKASIWYLLSLLMRNALPRVRIDQLMLFNWLFLVPVSIINLILVAFLMFVIRELGLQPDDPRDFVQNIPQTVVLLLGNVALLIGTLTVIRNRFRAERLAEQSTMLPAQAGD
ncbi:MAG: NADH-quinone oxidoreductase subunit NuoH [Phototrophicales bacterium]|nr:MAG: NADH-quinone oxidoreductase subunit NuoH [Phototrophicales bacterium]